MASAAHHGWRPVSVSKSGPRSGIRLSFPSVDDCLGPSGRRFFGSGYRRVRYAVRDAMFESSARGGLLRARAGIEHPADWSSKSAGIVGPPHLTTVDCLLLAVRTAEFCVRCEHGAPHRRRLRSWPRRVDIRAGGTPCEDDLGDLPLDARYDELRSAGTSDAPGVSSIDCRVATMRARVELAHDAVAVPRPRYGPVADELLGARYPGDYGRGYQLHRQAIRDLTVDLGTGFADASVDLGLESPVPLPAGAGPAPARPASMIDGFVVVAQLGQALLYEFDGLRREDTDTLWMRRTTIRAGSTAARGRAAATTRLTATARMCEPKLVTVRGRVWRTAVIDGVPGDVHVSCAVAHRLPVAV